MKTLPEGIIACAQIVERGDPLRFRTVMAAPLHARAALFPLYAFHVEVSRAPWVTQEPMIAEMRLQWWRDVLEECAEGKTVRAHEVTTPLAGLLSPQLAKMLDDMVSARRWDIYKDPFENEEHFRRYIDQTSGHLLWTAVCLLGDGDEKSARRLAWGAGIAAYLRAIPALEAAGRIPLLDGRAKAIKLLAGEALEAVLAQPRVSKAAYPALWPAIGASATLRQAIRDPMAVSEGRLPAGPSAWRLSASVATGRLMT